MEQKIELLMGNEAIARGAIESGLEVATSYPGTPSSEIFGTLAEFAPQFNYYAEWSTNEKVALEVAGGAAYTGAKAMVPMKQVGLNVAADPLMTLAYLGIDGALVLAVADDPGPHSSQNEQDTRHFAKMAKLPVFDPATPQEAKRMTKRAFVLSEELGLPVFVRPTTRICHGCADVELETVEKDKEGNSFKKDGSKVIFPDYSYQRHKWLTKQQKKLKDIFKESDFNQLETEGDLGVITSGASYNFAKEAIELLGTEISILKLGTPYPLPEELIIDYLADVEQVLIIEEQDPVVEEQVIKIAWHNDLDVEIYGKETEDVPYEGEFNVDLVKSILLDTFGIENGDDKKDKLGEEEIQTPELPVRPPVLCAGCPHRASFLAVKRATKDTEAIFTGDIGCYTLGIAPPLEMLDTCLCMGASITVASGLDIAEPERPQIAFLGDSTFFHTGVPGLLNAIYNESNITIVILDNRTTAMTGHQPHPGTEQRAVGPNENLIKFDKLLAGCQLDFIRQVDPYDLEAMEQEIREAVAYEGVSVIVAERECVTLVNDYGKYEIDQVECSECNLCLTELGCPAVAKEEEKVFISEQCIGCGICVDICPTGAIKELVE